jgi:bacteriocin-like protein
MTKLNETQRANINVLSETELSQVVGGRGHCGGGRRKSYENNHCDSRPRRNEDYGYGGGYGGGYDCSDKSDNDERYEDCHEDKSERRCEDRRWY